MIYSPAKDTTTTRRDPGIGLAGCRTCDQCQTKRPIGFGWTRGRVAKGPLRGLNGWVCQHCKEAQ